ncbi:MAG: Fur family transcriptional regulator, partial [Anaerolineae bacterium]
MKPVDDLIELFHHSGLRITPQRRAIFELLAENNGHLTADEMYRHVRSMMPDISRATVYNTLHELVALGELTTVEDLSKRGTRYDTTTSHHHH